MRFANVYKTLRSSELKRCTARAKLEAEVYKDDIIRLIGTRGTKTKEVRSVIRCYNLNARLYNKFRPLLSSKLRGIPLE